MQSLVLTVKTAAFVVRGIEIKDVENLSGSQVFSGIGIL